MKRVAVVTGANRGLGFETARQLLKQGYEVILGIRDPKKGEQALEKLKSEDLTGRFFPLDVTLGKSIQDLSQYLERELGRVDVLVNNAGIMPDDTKSDFASALVAPVDTLRKAMETNVYGPLQLCQRLIPLMKKNNYGRIVNLSSGMGQLTEMNGGYPAYRISKTALNAVTRIFADETQGANILINSVCPGWVRTDMGGANAERDVSEGASGIVWAATLPDGGPTGGFFRDRERLDW